MTNQTKINKLENGRAEFAYVKANEGADLDDKDAKKYKSYVKKIPVIIKTNGLGNTLAFIKSKKDSVYDIIYGQLSDWLRQDNSGAPLLPTDRDLLEFILQMDSLQYRQMTTECIALFSWLRRLAEGLIEGDEDYV